MKLFDYTGLLNVIKEVNLETAKLNNVKEMALKNKYLDMERKLFDSGILEDWVRLNKVVTDRIFFSRWNSECLNNIYRNSEKFVEYRDNVFSVIMSSGSSWTDYFYINPNSSVKNGKVIWCIENSSNRFHIFDRFKNEEEEYRIKIFMIETLMATYENYRDFVLEKVAEKLNKNIANNSKLRNEIAELI